MAGLPNPAEVEDFNEKVDEVARLINGLQKGTLSPEYIDSRYEEQQGKEKKKEEQKKIAEETLRQEQDPARQAELKRKV